MLVELTNGSYALSLTKADLPLVNRVARAYIDGKVGPDTPIWEREKAYNEWLEAEYDYPAWERARLEDAGKVVF